MTKLVKAVLIYDKENHTSVYGRDYTNSIKTIPDLLSGFVSAIETLNDNKHLIQGFVPESITMDQFTFYLDDNKVRIKDANGIHINVYNHLNERYGGLLSVDKRVDYSLSNNIFKSLINEIDKHHITSIGLSKKVITRLNKIIDDY